MSVLSIPQIGAVASAAGFQGSDLATAVAIALAESNGGNPQAYNPETQARGGTPQGEGSYGLWQIYLRDHPQFDPSQLFDPQYNANAAFSLYQSAGGFQPWSTYTQGQYRGYLAAVNDALASSPDESTGWVSEIPTSSIDPTTLMMLGAGVLAVAWLAR